MGAPNSDEAAALAVARWEHSQNVHSPLSKDVKSERKSTIKSYLGGMALITGTLIIKRTFGPS